MSESKKATRLERGVTVHSPDQPLFAMRAPAVLFALLLWSARGSALLEGHGLRGSVAPSWAARGNGGDLGADRETQSPLVWLRLHKTELERTAPSWHDISFAEQAAERQGELNAKRTNP